MLVIEHVKLLFARYIFLQFSIYTASDAWRGREVSTENEQIVGRHTASICSVAFSSHSEMNLIFFVIILVWFIEQRLMRFKILQSVQPFSVRQRRDEKCTFNNNIPFFSRSYFICHGLPQRDDKKLIFNWKIVFSRKSSADICSLCLFRSSAIAFHGTLKTTPSKVYFCLWQKITISTHCWGDAPQNSIRCSFAGCPPPLPLPLRSRLRWSLLCRCRVHKLARTPFVQWSVICDSFGYAVCSFPSLDWIAI